MWFLAKHLCFSASAGCAVVVAAGRWRHHQKQLCVCCPWESRTLLEVVVLLVSYTLAVVEDGGHCGGGSNRH